jgi:hypothetical protein
MTTRTGWIRTYDGGLVNLDVCTSVVAHSNAHGHHEWQVIAYDTTGQRSHVLASYHTAEEAQAALAHLAGLLEPIAALAEPEDAR